MKGSKKMSEATYKTKLTKVNETYLPMVINQLENNNITLSEYAKSCVVNAISAINNVLDANGISWGGEELDTSSVTQILLSVAALQLNAAPTANEVFFQIRSVSMKDADGKQVWTLGNDTYCQEFWDAIK